jgi:hypothetical protein
MKRTKSAVGLLVLSALCLCAFGVANASAENLTLEECTGVQSGSTSTEFTSSTCGTKGAGSFRKTPIVGSQKVFPTLTETNFAGKTEGETAGVHAVLHTVVAGVSFQITCGKLSSPNSVGENIVSEAMGFKGSGTSVFNECKVTKPTSCTVPAELKTSELLQTNSEMKVTFKPKEGTKFITIPVGGESCPAAFKGEKEVTGEAIGTAEGESISFNSESGNNLKFGGNAAQFTAKIHFSTENGTKLFASTKGE